MATATSTPKASSSKRISPEPFVKPPSVMSGSIGGQPSMGRSMSSREKLLEEIAAALDGRGTPRPSLSRTSSSAVRERFLAELGGVPGPSRSPLSASTTRERFMEDLGEIPGSSAASAAHGAGTARPMPNRSASMPTPNSFRPGSGLSRDGLFEEIDRLHEILARAEYREASEASAAQHHRDREMTKLVRDMRADLAAERHRADAAEKRAREAMKHVALYRENEQALERSRAQILENLKAYRDELKAAHEQLRIAQQEIDKLAREKHAAEEDAANARAAARRATSTLEAERAREEGLRAGMEAARQEWQRVLASHEAEQEEEEDDYVMPEMPSQAPSVRAPRRTARGAQTPGPPRRQQTVDPDDDDDEPLRVHAQLLEARLRDAQRELAAQPGQAARVSAYTDPGREEEILQQMTRRTEARIKLLFPPGPLGITSCVWHQRHREPPPFAAGMAPQAVLNCGCSMEEGLFEEALMRNSVGSLAGGQANFEPELRRQLLALLKKRWDYQDGDFEIDRETGDWRASEGPEYWEHEYDSR
ncbi:hypothetical protein AURDEDRAFT_130419 [Auricularia subglabra TFB-10046 SS5]|uniref:Uncharacterized protein n=1 Tax=Auricularia subglabra (strain TFB-10046 / SS5) TaxID=717982 RepID=J0D8P4_AURST|nr:hypothetical protein AURDEDRAFT_130419 [Auricularia subglabra TFB-10046 SS5]